MKVADGGDGMVGENCGLSNGIEGRRLTGAFAVSREPIWMEDVRVCCIPAAALFIHYPICI